MQNHRLLQHFSVCRRPTLRRRGMTLIELLIVIVIIGVLISAVMVASTSLIGKSKTRNTQAVLQLVADAAEQFKRSETEKPTITRNAAYKKRYGLYPPDELEVFSNAGVPGATTPTNLASPSGSVIVPDKFPNMRFYTDGTADDATEHRDLAALIVAIESQGGEAAAILDRIADRNRSAGALDNDGKPVQYLNRPEGISKPPRADFNEEDLQIRYILDDWGMPIGYFAQRDSQGHNSTGGTPSSNSPNWNLASTEIIRANGGIPVIYSYGPNGKDQLTGEMMGTEGAASLVGDFAPATPSPENAKDVIDHPANADNVYLNNALKEKLSQNLHGDEG